jgi:hypothetical protein
MERNVSTSDDRSTAAVIYPDRPETLEPLGWKVAMLQCPDTRAGRTMDA